jgi:uncharacterized protein YfdQ (DUF2303 family)
MFDKDALTLMQQAQAITNANTAVVAALSDRGVISAPSDFATHDLEKFMPQRRRMRGTMETSVVGDFAQYTLSNKEDGAAVFIDSETLTALAVLNLGTPDKPGHADNRAKLISKSTAAYKAFLAIANGQGRTQKDIAEFFEDWTGHLEFFTETGEVTPPKAIAAVRKITIEELKKQATEVAQLSANRSAFESVSASSTDPIPTTIYFKCQPYLGLEDRVFVLRLSILTGGPAPAIALRIAKQEQHNEEMAEELAKLVGRAVTGLPVLIGKYSAAS